MVKVYQFRVWDATNDGWIIQPRKSPAQRIHQVGGELIEGTEEEVSSNDLDEHGRYMPDA